MKRIVLFGSGVVAEKNLGLKPEFIVDNNRDLQGQEFHGVSILGPEALIGRQSDYDVVVCSTSIDAIKPQLEQLGYEWGVSARVAGQLAERLVVDKLETQAFSFLVSSGLPSHLSETAGGGVYLIREEGERVLVKKLFQGNVHGLIKSEKAHDFYFNAQGDGIYRLTLEGDDALTARVVEVPGGLRPHGMARYLDDWLIVSSYDDALIRLNAEGQVIGRYDLGAKKQSLGSAQNHCNDVAVANGFAYVSMFSVSGNWKRGVFDGGVVEVDLAKGHSTVVSNVLTMPHNISFYNNELRIMNSFKGEIMVGNFEVLGTLPGFVRGYDEDDDYIYVGESKNRNFSRLNTGRSPVSIDTRITIIDKEIRACRSIQLPRTVSEIHSVIRLSP